MKKIIISTLLLISVNSMAELVEKKCVETKASREEHDYSYDLNLSQSNKLSLHIALSNLAGHKELVTAARLDLKKLKKTGKLTYKEIDGDLNSDGTTYITLDKDLSSPGPVTILLEGEQPTGSDSGPAMLKYPMAVLVCN